RRRYAIPAAVWRSGINIIRFEFERTIAPADVDPRSSDRRPLAARVFAIGIDGYDAPDALHPVHFADLPRDATNLADESLCMDDRQFLQRAFLGLVGRDIAEWEMRNLQEELQRGVSRRAVVRRLTNRSQ